MLAKIKTYPFLLLVLVSLGLASYQLSTRRWPDEHWKNTIQSDGSGYYAYLPAIFIYQDLQYRFYLDLKDKYKFGDLSENFLYTKNNRFYNRYFCGTAIAMLPFFILGWVVAYLTGQELDGHSFIFTASINFAAIFYVLSGLYFMYRMYSRRYNKWLVTLCCFAVFVGSNVFTYAVYHSSHSHAYSFGFICLFIYLADRSILRRTSNSVYHLALCLGIIVLIRPTNIIVVLSLPFIAGNMLRLKEWLRSCFQFKTIALATVLFLMVVSIQSVMYYLQCHSLWTDGYPYETFYFDQPELINMWFSYRAGVLLWSPIVIFGIFGLIRLSIQNKFAGAAFLLFMFVNSWIISSWWVWHYSGTFGMRPMVDYMPFFIPLILQPYTTLPKKVSIQVLTGIFMIGLAFIGFTFNRQYQANIIPWDGMTKEKYWYVFMKTDEKFGYRLFEPYRPIMPEPKEIMIKHITFEQPSDETTNYDVSEKYHTDKLVNYDGTGIQTLGHFPLLGLKGASKYYAEIKVNALYTSVHNKGELYLKFLQGNNTIRTEKFSIVFQHFQPNVWNELRQVFIVDTPQGIVDGIELEIHNGERLPVYLQKLEFTLASL